MKIGFLGYGSIAHSHARAILALRDEGHDLQIYGVMGRLADATAEFAREYGAPVATTNLDQFLADPALDAVIICSPSDAHAAQTEQALRAGKHVLCEIPLALSGRDRCAHRASRRGRAHAYGLPHSAFLLTTD